MSSNSERNYRLLIVDDNDSIHSDFRQILRADAMAPEPLDEYKSSILGDEKAPPTAPSFELSFAHQGEEGLRLVEQSLHEAPFSLAFVDVRMPPGWDGYKTAARMLEADPDLQIVICTAFSDHSTADILQRFYATDRLLVLKKPFDALEVSLMAVSLCEKWRVKREAERLIRVQSEHIADARRVMAIVQKCHDELETAHQDLKDYAEFLTDRLQQRTLELLGTRDVTVFALAQLAESRDPETGEHLQRMQAYAQRLAEYLNLNGPYRNQISKPFLEDFYRSTPLHDIGKVGIPDSILLKPDRLTPEEFEVMKRHTLIGAEALERAVQHGSSGGFLNMAADIARHHHERWDGNGYPFGLKGEAIPLTARITSVADVFDALTSARVYKDAMPTEKAKSIIVDGRGTQFDPVVLDAFVACYDDFLEIKDNINSRAADVKPLAASVKGLLDVELLNVAISQSVVAQ